MKPKKKILPRNLEAVVKRPAVREGQNVRKNTLNIRQDDLLNESGSLRVGHLGYIPILCFISLDTRIDDNFASNSSSINS